ncbi:hypothetical protein GOOTI_187_00570 [Gordonia otitidis NBRC 100426]|uniref:Uncharacterized protein n=1 Tax=Gordonia otitidis (strain DSM 44809 / CCUG 52243 / JCM 12355 / NBRC 100426 / IFM 10032) TaxID=1108044 RepID=H5TR14_GORO1|nr:hypothetical protein GOOTI_187_00570 [Gordonia otitidis NBRC 100426]
MVRHRATSSRGIRHPHRRVGTLLPQVRDAIRPLRHLADNGPTTRPSSRPACDPIRDHTDNNPDAPHRRMPTIRPATWPVPPRTTGRDGSGSISHPWHGRRPRTERSRDVLAAPHRPTPRAPRPPSGTGITPVSGTETTQDVHPQPSEP